MLDETWYLFSVETQIKVIEIETQIKEIETCN